MKITDEMVERAAVAIIAAWGEDSPRYRAWDSIPDADRDVIRRDARAALEAALPEDNTEWEYGVTSKWGTRAVSDGVRAEQDAAAIRREIEMGRASGDLTYHGIVMRRRRTIPAGPWEPVPTENGSS